MRRHSSYAVLISTSLMSINPTLERGGARATLSLGSDRSSSIGGDMVRPLHRSRSGQKQGKTATSTRT